MEIILQKGKIISYKNTIVIFNIFATTDNSMIKFSIFKKKRNHCKNRYNYKYLK